MRALNTRQLLHVVILGVGAHSIVAGLILLFAPQVLLGVVGWGYAGELFWPRQAGLFLSILGVAYCAAVRLPSLVWLVIGSKLAAFIFLMAHAMWLDGAQPVLYLAVGDGLMCLAVAVALHVSER